MEIRNVTNEDIPQIRDIANQAWKNILKHARQQQGDKIADVIRPYGDNLSKGYQVQKEIQDGNVICKVCTYQGNVVGFITYIVKGKIGTIGNNAALPDSGLKGIGQCMYHYALQDMKRLGAQIAMVDTGLDDAHAPARRAYERAGFNRHLENITYYLDLDDIALP